MLHHFLRAIPKTAAVAGKVVVINSSTGTGASVSFTSSGFGTSGDINFTLALKL
jgi:hypothetical protein